MMNVGQNNIDSISILRVSAEFVNGICVCSAVCCHSTNLLRHNANLLKWGWNHDRSVLQSQYGPYNNKKGIDKSNLKTSYVKYLASWLYSYTWLSFSLIKQWKKTINIWDVKVTIKTQSICIISKFISNVTFRGAQIDLPILVYGYLYI